MTELCCQMTQTLCHGSATFQLCDLRQCSLLGAHGSRHKLEIMPLNAVLSPMTFFPWAHYGNKVWVDWRRQELQGILLLSEPLKTTLPLMPPGPNKTLQRVQWTHKGQPTRNSVSLARKLDVGSVPLLACSFLHYFSPFLVLYLPDPGPFCPFFFPFLKNGLC